MFFFFNDTATTEIYTLSLHDALPIWGVTSLVGLAITVVVLAEFVVPGILSGASPLVISVLGALMIAVASIYLRSEEHTSELQSLAYLVCRLLLEKKKHIADNKEGRLN